MVFWVAIAFIAGFLLFVILKAIWDDRHRVANARLSGYHIVIVGNLVKSYGDTLGPLAGARAEVTDGTSRRTLTRVVTVAGAFTKRTKAAVIVTTANGGFHQQNIEGASELRRAQAWVIRFNTMAAAEERKAVQPGVPATSLPDPGDALAPAAREVPRAQREAVKWEYMRRVTDGEEPACDPVTAAGLVGAVVGLYARVLTMTYPGRFTKEQALEWGRQSIRDRLTMAAALAAVKESDGEDGGTGTGIR